LLRHRRRSGELRVAPRRAAASTAHRLEQLALLIGRQIAECFELVRRGRLSLRVRVRKAQQPYTYECDTRQESGTGYSLEPHD
jgi:hypothetical protein